MNEKIDIKRLVKSIMCTFGVFLGVILLIWLGDKYPDVIFGIIIGSILIFDGVILTQLFYKQFFKK